MHWEAKMTSKLGKLEETRMTSNLGRREYMNFKFLMTYITHCHQCRDNQ